MIALCCRMISSTFGGGFARGIVVQSYAFRKGNVEVPGERRGAVRQL